MGSPYDQLPESRGEGQRAPTTGNQAQPNPIFPASKFHRKTICEIMISPEHSTEWGRTFPVPAWAMEGMAQQWEGHMGEWGAAGTHPALPNQECNQIK